MTRSPPAYILDISRLLSRAGQPIPTGIDRVELAYADYLLAHHADATYFVTLNIAGGMGALPYRQVKRFVDELLSGWNLGQQRSVIRAKKIARHLKGYALLGYSALRHLPKPSLYLLLSHHHLMRQSLIRRFLSETGARFVPMVHDLIPIEYPEYARPREPKRHHARIKTVVDLADAVIVPTHSVEQTLRPHLIAAKRPNVPIWVVPHGVHQPATDMVSGSVALPALKRPYFVYLSTIEPRKNHLLLLHLWRKMVDERGEDQTPYLLLIGKRGWENENILDLLERSPALKNVVLELNQLSDRETIQLLKQSNGLLFPSFTEGYGLPLVEAMSLSVPSICSDISVLREVGNDVPVYIDPLDSVEWQRIIDDFSKNGSLWREQIIKLRDWKAFPWTDSIAQALFYCSALP